MMVDGFTLVTGDTIMVVVFILSLSASWSLATTSCLPYTGCPLMERIVKCLRFSLHFST